MEDASHIQFQRFDHLTRQSDSLEYAVIRVDDGYAKLNGLKHIAN